MPINRIYQSNINLIDPVNGTKKLQGMIDSADLPEISFAMDEDARLGRFSVVDAIMGIESQEMTITFSAWSDNWASAIRKFRTPFTLQFRGALEDADGIDAVGSYVITTKHKPVNNPMGSFEPQSAGTWEVTLKTIYCRQVINGVEKLLWDAIANQYIVDGVDQLAEINAALGV